MFEAFCLYHVGLRHPRFRYAFYCWSSVRQYPPMNKSRTSKDPTMQTFNEYHPCKIWDQTSMHIAVLVKLGSLRTFSAPHGLPKRKRFCLRGNWPFLFFFGPATQQPPALGLPIRIADLPLGATRAIRAPVDKAGTRRDNKSRAGRTGPLCFLGGPSDQRNRPALK